MPPLGRGAKLGYAAGSLLDGIAIQAVGIFLFVHVTAMCGVPGALAGAALSIGLVVDAVMDPLLGSMSDGLRSRWGRRLPLMMVGLPGTALFLVVIFSLPTGLSAGKLAAWLACLSIGLRVSMSLFLLPYLAVGAELSDNYAERSSIMAWRWGGATIGALAAILLGFVGGAPGTPPFAYQPGQLLFDAADPTAVVGRLAEPFLRIDPAEAQGQVGNVCFAEGLVAFGGEWRLYVGLADSRLGVATAPLRA